MTATGKHPTQVTDNAATDLEPSWFPSGSKLACRCNGNANISHIWVLNLGDDGLLSGETRFTKKRTANIRPAVSPDGTGIAFASFRDGDFDISVMDVAPDCRDNRPRNLTGNAVDDFNPDRSPDGTRLAFGSRRGQQGTADPNPGLKIVEVNADGGRPHRLTTNQVIDRDPVWSPDGKRIAFERALHPGAGPRDILPDAGGRHQRLQPHRRHPGRRQPVLAAAVPAATPPGIGRPASPVAAPSGLPRPGPARASTPRRASGRRGR